jgi:hypothetical protein
MPWQTTPLIEVHSVFGKPCFLHLADIFVAAPVEFFGGDTWNDVFPDHFQYFGGHAPGDAHLRDVFVVLEFDCHCLP